MLIGNDSEKFAFSIDPEIILPTQSHHVDSEYVQGDVIFCHSFKLPAGFSTTINVQPSFMRNGSDTENEFGFTSGITLYHNLFRKQDRVQLYLEYYDTLVTGPGFDGLAAGGHWRALAALGEHAVRRRVQFRRVRRCAGLSAFRWVSRRGSDAEPKREQPSAAAASVYGLSATTLQLRAFMTESDARLCDEVVTLQPLRTDAGSVENLSFHLKNQPPTTHSHNTLCATCSWSSPPRR